MIISHWCTLIEGFQAPPLEFYKCIEEAIDRRQVPGLRRKRVVWPEGGLLSAKRVYLRLSREYLLFDVCAAPFGTGYFVSCRLVDKEAPWQLMFAVVLFCFLTLMFTWVFFVATRESLALAFASIALIAPILLGCAVAAWFAQRFLRGVLVDIDQLFLSSPYLGTFYERFTRRNTYYRLDQVLMFQQAVQAAVLEVVDKHIDAQHLKPLSELDRKPVFAKLLTR